jgi:hypothetical protein
MSNTKVTYDDLLKLRATLEERPLRQYPNIIFNGTVFIRTELIDGVPVSRTLKLDECLT